MKDHADYMTDKELEAEIQQLVERIKSGIPDEDELRRDAYFNDPANQAKIEATFARMELVEAMYKARSEAGLSQKEIAKRIGKPLAYIQDMECGRKNIRFSTLAKYARACGKKVALL